MNFNIQEWKIIIIHPQTNPSIPSIKFIKLIIEVPISNKNENIKTKYFKDVIVAKIPFPNKNEVNKKVAIVIIWAVKRTLLERQYLSSINPIIDIGMEKKGR